MHRWRLSEPERGTVAGVCRRCGAQRRYPAGIQLPPPPAEEPEEEPELDLTKLAKEISAMERQVLV